VNDNFLIRSDQKVAGLEVVLWGGMFVLRLLEGMAGPMDLWQ
jgi:hypothetical protein